MMHTEFEKLAGYEVSYETYTNIIEPMYMATNLSKAEFIRTLNRKALELKKERKPNVKKMLVRDRSGFRKTPNGFYYNIQYVDLLDVDIRTRKYTVAPLSNEELAKIYKSGHSLDVSGTYDMDYIDCIDSKRKPIDLSWAF